MSRLLSPHGLENNRCYLAEDGTTHGMPRERLARICRECDLYVNLCNLNWIPELEECRRRVLVDTDPVFTQIGALGMGGSYTAYDCLFTYGANVHRPDCTMPTAGARWLPTRQPIVLDMWRVEPGNPTAPFTTLMNWAPLADCHDGQQVYGQKARAFEPFVTLPRDTGRRMEIALSIEPKVCDPDLAD